jgi:hypothetical protein
MAIDCSTWRRSHWALPVSRSGSDHSVPPNVARADSGSGGSKSIVMRTWWRCSLISRPPAPPAVQVLNRVGYPLFFGGRLGGRGVLRGYLVPRRMAQFLAELCDTP